MQRSQWALAGLARAAAAFAGHEGTFAARIANRRTVFAAGKTTSASASDAPSNAAKEWTDDNSSNNGASTWSECASAQVGSSRLGIHTSSMRGIADGAAVVQQGGTQMMAAVVVDPNYNPSRMFYKFEISYRDRACAYGRIPTTFHRRETAPRDGEIVVMGLLEQIFRPLIPSGYCHDTILDTMLLSREEKGVDQRVLAINAVSAAVTCAQIPWEGPVAAVQVAVKGGEIILSPSAAEREAADGVLLYVGTEDRSVLVAGEAKEVESERLEAALMAAHEAVGPLVAAQRQAAEGWNSRMSSLRIISPDPSALATIKSLVEAKVEEVIRDASLGTMQTARALRIVLQELRESLVKMGYWRNELIRVEGSGTVSPNDMELGFKSTTARAIKRLLKEEGLRPDGRGPLDSRDHSVAEKVLPGVHGSSLIQAGEGKVLATVTVGGGDDRAYPDPVLDDFRKQNRKLLMLQFGMSMPLESYRGSSIVLTRRQESFNAYLLENALRPVLPDPSGFPFAVRLNVELLGVVDVPPVLVLQGASKALKSIGVPITRTVGGASVGIVAYEDSRDGQFELLDDVSDLEEEVVEMEVQVAGTAHGITAIHAACQSGGVAVEEMLRALRRARENLSRSLGKHSQDDEVVDEEAEGSIERIASLPIPKDCVVIGTQGSTIKRIEEQSGATLVVTDDAVVHFFAPSPEQLKIAIQAVKDTLPSSVNDGEMYSVKVVSIKDFGAFVEFPNKMQSLLHISELAEKRVKAVTDVVKIGDEVDVIVMGRDNKGNLKISRKAALSQAAAEKTG